MRNVEHPVAVGTQQFYVSTARGTGSPARLREWEDRTRQRALAGRTTDSHLRSHMACSS